MAAENPLKTKPITDKDRIDYVEQLEKQALSGDQGAFVELDIIALGGNLHAQQLIRALDNNLADAMVGAAEDGAV